MPKLKGGMLFYWVKNLTLPTNAVDYLRRVRALPINSSQSSHVEELSKFGQVLINKKTDLSVETVLLVVHESERTGAPVLGLNLAKELSKVSNVLVLLLDSKGPLTENFVHSGASCVVAGQVHGRPDAAQKLVNELAMNHQINYAIVNSIESSLHVLPALAERSIFTINLIHEFSSCYGNKTEVWRNICLYPGDFVFSTSLTMDDAIRAYPNLRNRRLHVLPQGRSNFPEDLKNQNNLPQEIRKISQALRPPGADKKLNVIVGMGSVHQRKGVDLFIQTAFHVKKLDPNGLYRFVWIGKSHDKHHNWGYYGFLQDQIDRSGLQSTVFMIDDTFALDEIYKQLDLLLITSRLDPLPNVAIDAMEYSKPVLCFDKATGIAEYISSLGLKETCVANFMDTNDMASKIVNLCANQDLRKEIGALQKTLPNQYFKMDAYAQKLINIFNEKKVRVENLKEKLDFFSSPINVEYYLTPTLIKKYKVNSPELAYINAWEDFNELARKPFPGFNPLIYKEENHRNLLFNEPYIDYLKNGKPCGRWCNKVISADNSSNLCIPQNNSVALHIHVHYPELLPEIMHGLSFNKICPDIFISATSEEVLEKSEHSLIDYPGTIKKRWKSSRNGRDIAPFLFDFLQSLPDNYKFIGHIHTKKSPHVSQVIGEEWRNFLYKNLLGAEPSVNMADQILSALNTDRKIGLIFPDDPQPISWGVNEIYAKNLASRINLINLPENFNFPIGTMFWAKKDALKGAINILTKDDMPDEPLPIDGTILHAFERLLPFIANQSGYDYATTYVPGVTR